jgi:hypothetical protein
MTKLTEKQAELLEFFNEGKKLVQLNNRLYMNDEVLHTKIFSSLMYKLYPNNWDIVMKSKVIIL